MNKSFQKFLAASVSAVVVASAVAPVIPINVLSAEAAAKDFKDVDKESYYYEAVMNLSSRGVINGFTDNTFRPNEQVTRAQAAAIIAASLGLTGKSSANLGFKDVQEGAWHHQAIAALVERKIMSGVDKDHFHPNKPVTRAELSKMIGLAYHLKPSTGSSKKFTDVPETSWYSGFVGAMIENKITSGMTTTTFAPNGKVTRGQMAAFIFRAENSLVKSVAIEKVTNDSITISGTTYKLAESVKSILNLANEATLKNADIHFQSENGTVTNITYLELKASGTASAHLLLDAKGGTVDGTVKISADNVTVKNLTTKGNFELAKEVQTSFTSDKLTVEGKTIITDEAAQAIYKAASSNKVYKTLTKTISQPIFKKAAIEAPKTNITFQNATLKVVEVKKQDVKVESKGTTKLEELSVSSNVTITATEGITIPKLTVQQGASQVEVNGAVQQLSVQSTDTFTLSGKANIDKLNIHQKTTVNLQSMGEIKEINSTNKDTQITLDRVTRIGNINLPEGTNVSDIITNYDEVKTNIREIGGEPNPDGRIIIPMPNPNPTPLPPAPDTTAPTIADLQHEALTHNAVNVKLSSNESGKVYYVALPADAPSPTKQQIKAGQDSIGAAASLKGNLAINGQTLATIPITGLTAETSYKIYLVVEDTSLNLSDLVSVEVTTAEMSPVDTTPPVIELPFGATGEDSTKLGFHAKVNENATAYYVVLPENAETPTLQQVKQGLDHNDQTALNSGRFALNANERMFSFIYGFTPSTTYKFVTFIEDTFGNATELYVFTPTTKEAQTPTDPGVIQLEEMELVTNIQMELDKHDLLSDKDNLHLLSIISVNSRNSAIVEASLSPYGTINLNPKAIGSAEIIFVLNNGEIARFTINVNSLQIGLDALNALSIGETTNSSYMRKVAKAILEGTAELNVAANAIYQNEQDYFKERVAEWVIRKKPAQGYASIADVISTFNLVVDTVKALDEESMKYRYEIDVLSTVGTDNLPVDVTSKLYYYPNVTLDETINKQIVVNQYFSQNAHLQLGTDGKVVLVKNNTTTAPAQESISITFEKNGITKNHYISANVIHQGVQLTNPIVEINSNYPVQVTRPGQEVFFYVSSDYQIDEIIAEQNGQSLAVSYWAMGQGNREMYRVILNDVNGADQTLNITARIGDKTGTDSIVLEDWTWPIITNVQKDTANSKFIVTFSEPVQKRSETTNFNEAFRVSQGEVLNVTQIDDRNFNVEVSDINADYLETPTSVHGNFMDFADKIYSSNDIFVFNPTTAVLDAVFAKVNTPQPLNMYEVSSRKGVYIVDGDQFSYDTLERPDSFYDVHIEDLLLSDSEEQALEKIDAYFYSPQFHPYNDLEYIGVEGYKVTDVLTGNDLGGVALNRSIYFFAKFRTASGDIAYSQKRAGLWVNEVDKEFAMQVVNTLLGKIPTDLTGYGHSDLDGYQRDLSYQINQLKTLGATDVEIQALTNYAKYEALKALVDQLNNQ